MIALNPSHQALSNNAVSRKTWLLLVGISGAATAFLLILPSKLFSWQSVVVTIGLTVMFALLWVALGVRGAREQWPERIFLVIWWVLLVSEEIFDPFVLPKFGVEAAENAFAGRFSVAAYGEAAIWLLAGAISLLCLLRRPDYLRGLWSKPYRWVALFGLICVASTYYTPQPLFALAWAFKLIVVIIIVKASATFLQSTKELTTFFEVTLLGFLLLSVVPLVLALIHPTYSDDGRLGNIAPDGLSATGGTLFLIALMLFSVSRKRWLVPVALVGLTVMIFAGGKTAIAAGILCGLLYFLLQGRLIAAIGLIAGLAASGALIMTFTPLAQHFTWYFSSGQLGTLSGRAHLWRTVVPEIWQRPFIGHGYLASRFVALQVEKVPFGAPHMHNGFLEVLYNDGIVGLLVMSLIQIVITVNLVKAFRRSRSSRALRLFTVGSIVLFLNLLINGLFNASFGGRAEAPFMLLLALVAISENLAGMAGDHREALVQNAE